MNYLSYPLSYFVNGKPCTSFSFTKKNKTTASYEIRLTDSFSVRVYLPLALCSKLSKAKPSQRKYVCWFACLKISNYAK